MIEIQFFCYVQTCFRYQMLGSISRTSEFCNQQRLILLTIVSLQSVTDYTQSVTRFTEKKHQFCAPALFYILTVLFSIIIFAFQMFARVTNLSSTCAYLRCFPIFELITFNQFFHS